MVYAIQEIPVFHHPTTVSHPSDDGVEIFGFSLATIGSRRIAITSLWYQETEKNIQRRMEVRMLEKKNFFICKNCNRSFPISQLFIQFFVLQPHENHYSK